MQSAAMYFDPVRLSMKILAGYAGTGKKQGARMLLELVQAVTCGFGLSGFLLSEGQATAADRLGS